MDRLTKAEFSSLKACDKCIEFDECHQKQCVQVYDALLKLKRYEDLELQLQEAYGECDGLLEESIKYLVEHEGIDLDNPGKARLLTDGSVDMWEEYKKIGTVEECREAREKQMGKKPVLCMNEASGMFVDYADGHGEYRTQMNNWWRCPCCNKVVGQRVIVRSHIHDQRKKNYCENCGQAIDWSKS